MTKKSAFRFEARNGKKTLFFTESRACVPDKKTRASMKKAGLSLYLNGKPFKEADL